MIYAVNKRTLEHRVAYGDEAFGNMPDDTESHAFLEADPDGWIEWQGGECPLPNDQPVEAKTGSGEQAKFNAAGHVIGWKKAIVAYRPILDTDARHEPPAWDGEGLPPVGCECEWFRNAQWQRCEVVKYIGDYALVWDFDESWGYTEPLDSITEFRPIRSEEDRAVEAMKVAMENFPYDDTKQHLSELVYAAIRDGKVPRVKLEDSND